MPEPWVIAIVCGLLVAKGAAIGFLSGLNHRCLVRGRERPPPAIMDLMGAETVRKSVDYTIARSRVGLLGGYLQLLLLALLIPTGLLPRAYTHFLERVGATVWSEGLFIVLLAGFLWLISLPMDAWMQFGVEERFGFNRSTRRLWIADKIKVAIVNVTIGYPLICFLLALVQSGGALWWMIGFLGVTAFQVGMLLLYPRLILPLFNKLTPLPEGDLKKTLMGLADRAGFHADTIEVMDGSKRSSHSNAFFTGFGRFRRIVLFDTLVTQFHPKEVEAVLAHEIGHYRLGHVPRMLALSTGMVFAGFALLGWLSRSPWFVGGFGYSPERLAPVFLIAGLCGGLVTYWLKPLLNALSRRYEYQADAFAREVVGEAGPMIAALKMLARNNLINPMPHPIYSGFYYTHPTFLERVTALQEGAGPIESHSGARMEK